MTATRRRKRTPESPIAAKIRSYALAYAADGRSEHAAGMRQAADLVDGLLQHEGGQYVAKSNLNAALDSRGMVALERRVAALEVLVAGRTSSPSPSPTKKEAAGEHVLSSPRASLVAGEERILAALVQHGPRSSNELSALVAYRATSLATYLSNLRAVGYVSTDSGHHVATSSGISHAAGHAPIPIGHALYRSWLERLPPGEKTILACAFQAGPDGARVKDLVGEATGFKATSVNTYVSLLVRRRLILRPSLGRIVLAPILLEDP